MWRKPWFWIALIAVASTGLFWSLRDDLAYARLATGFAAKQTCSCLHVSERTMDACIADFPPDARSNIDVVADGDRVRASVLLGAISAEAVFEGGYGCALVN